MQKLVLQDQDGKTVRAFTWSGEPMQVIRRGDTRRLELMRSTEDLTKNKIPFENIGDLNQANLEQKPFLVGELGHLCLIDSVGAVDLNDREHEENRRILYFTLALLALLVFSMVSVFSGHQGMSTQVEQELKQQVVKIVKKMEKPAVPPQVLKTQQNTVTDKKPTKNVSIKRLGALSALGSLNSSKQKGGLNLGAAQTTAGPGLGGNAGSGGTQTSIYAKGIVSAPLGAGANVQGAGGYGTKGKGGGQAGYGNLALTGSAGASALPLGAEASVAKGLDRDQIAAVINRNQGQVRFCYEQGLQSDAALNGRVSVDFTIGGNGAVKAARIENSTLNAKSVEDCIVMRLKSWKFPLPDGGVDVKVSYPFTLRRSGQG